MSTVSVRAEHLSKKYMISVNKNFSRQIVGERIERWSRIAHASIPIQQTEFIEGRTVASERCFVRDSQRARSSASLVATGPGKSTLLKILSRITEPTQGRAEIYGRVGTLLEVGTGFHPELTGRENIYLNGDDSGHERAEIERKV